MKFCKSHWDELRKALDDRGLMNLVAKDSQQLMDKMAKEIADGQPSAATFDPLIGAHNAILSNALDIVGLDLMMPNDDGSDKCPLCYAITNCRCNRGDECDFRKWIDYAADEQLQVAKDLGSVGLS
jgi:hypothetical protein